MGRCSIRLRPATAHSEDPDIMTNSDQSCNGSLVLEHQWSGTKAKVTALFHGEPKHIDTIDPANANHRLRFVKAVLAKLPQEDGKALDAELLRIAVTARNPENPAPAGGPVELDISCIVRPELFMVREVCGLAVPVVLDLAGTPAGRWMLHLRWADGRRECRELPSYITLPDE